MRYEKPTTPAHRSYEVRGRYGYFAVHMCEAGTTGEETIISGLTKKNAALVAHALNAAYRHGRMDAERSLRQAQDS